MEPTPAEIRTARMTAGLTQAAAAALVRKSLKAWQNWECSPDLPSHRKMDPAVWELFLLKAKIPA